MKKLTKIEKYRKAIEDIAFTREEINKAETQLDEIGTITITDSLNIGKRSSESQYLFALGICKSRVECTVELGLDPAVYIDQIGKIKLVFELSKELNFWKRFLNELLNYQEDMYNLLDNDEKASLLEYPKRG